MPTKYAGRNRSIRTQQNATWKAFSRYIRMRDSVRTTGTLTKCTCYFCGKPLDSFRTRECAQAGHVVSRKYSRALYNPAVVYASCQHCNGYMEGNHVAGFIHMCDDLGFDRAAWYVLDAMQNGAHSFEELEDIEDGCNVACDILEEYYDTKCGNAARQI